MIAQLINRVACAAALALGMTSWHAQAAEDPLASWNEGPAKQAIVRFVGAVTTAGGADYVDPADRIATFDNDGTLWVEQPIYTQFAFALDRVRALASGHPEWKATQPFKAVIENDMPALAAGGEKAMVELVAATHAGMTTDEFTALATKWLAEARHPRFKRPYTELVYQPMLEVLAYLRANGFRTYIISGGGIDFMRPWTDRVYGIPPEQVLGSSIKTQFVIRDGVPVLMRLPAIDFVDDGPGKPVGIDRLIGRRPIAAFGNSDGDIGMLQWAAAEPGARLTMIVHHDDAEREYAYDRKSHVGRLDKALDAASAEPWVFVSMKADWRAIFPGTAP